MTGNYNAKVSLLKGYTPMCWHSYHCQIGDHAIPLGACRSARPFVWTWMKAKVWLFVRFYNSDNPYSCHNSSLDRARDMTLREKIDLDPSLKKKRYTRCLKNGRYTPTWDGWPYDHTEIAVMRYKILSFQYFLKLRRPLNWSRRRIFPKFLHFRCKRQARTATLHKELRRCTPC